MSLQEMVTAYSQADPFKFSRSANQLRKKLRALSPSIYPTESKLRLEYFYNHFEGFYRAIWLYGLAFDVLLISQLRKRGRALRTVGIALAISGLAFHATGIVLRCMIAGRPPVTNMYGSIIWVSFSASVVGMIFFARY